jgi:hypothetical protein
MKNITYTLIAFLIFNFCNAQGDLIIQSSGLGWVHSAPDYEGKKFNITQFFDLEKWEKAEIEKNQLVEARYNPFDDAIEIKQGDTIFELAKSNNRKVKFNDITYQAKSYYGRDDKIHTHYFIITEEPNVFKKVSFERDFSKPKTTLQYPSAVTNPPSYIKKYFYYFINDDNRLFGLTTKRKYIKEAFPEQAKSIINFSKVNNLNSNNEKDMIRLFQYIQSLNNEV